MASPQIEIEGTWEEIAAHAPELAGKRVRIMVLSTAQEGAVSSALSPENLQILHWLDEWEQTSLMQEEMDVLDGLEQHLNEHPFSLRQYHYASVKL